MSEIKVPEIFLPTINIPKTPNFTKHKLSGKIPGCNLTHRDLETTRNPSLLWTDKNGTFYNCPEGQIPSFDPIRYDANAIIFTEKAPVIETVRPQQTSIPKPKPKPKNKTIEPSPCPDLSRVLPVGSFTSDLRTSRIIDYKRANNGVDCYPIIEEVTFIKSVLPTPSAALNVVTISLLAASSPIILGLLKGLSKTIFKKVLTRFQKLKNVDEVKPD
jgi:hypothetical protein|tara:strand:- start:616 stop:1263 length:648 start_codon:yes stop_codon:yes gene_type:complete